MMKTHFARDGLAGRGIAAALLVYLFALVVVPAHGHEAGLLPESGGTEQSAPDQDPDCFLCQVLTVQALPAAAPVLADGTTAAEAGTHEADADHDAPHLLRANARAPPAR